MTSLGEAMVTECVYCEGKRFKTFEAYAEHILKRHSADYIRVGWAKEVLGLNGATDVPIVEEPPVVEGSEDEVLRQLSKIIRPELLEKLKGGDSKKVETPKKTRTSQKGGKTSAKRADS